MRSGDTDSHLVMATAESESESESLVLGYDSDIEENAELDAHERIQHDSGKKRFRKTNKRAEFSRNMNTESSSSGHRQDRAGSRVTHRSGWSDLHISSSSSESDIYPDSKTSSSNAKDQTTTRQDEHQGTTRKKGKCINTAAAKHFERFNDDPVSRNGRAAEPKWKQEGAVTFRPMKKHHRHRRKRSLPTVKSHDQEKMATFKKSHQHSTPSDLALYRKTNNLLSSGLIPVNMNIKISALIHPSYISRDEGMPVKRRKKTSLSSDSEAISDNEVHNEPLPINERRTTSLSRFREVFTIPDSSPDDDRGELRTKGPAKRRSSDSDVICIDSDSDHKNTSSRKPLLPNHVDTLIDISDDHSSLDDDETFVPDISGQYNAHDDDGADSDSSELPECPILEEMSNVTPCRSTAPSSYTAPPLFENDVENSKRIDHKCVKTEAVHVPSLERPVWPTSPPDDDRSRHSSGDCVEREEQATDACWVAFLLASGDTKASDLSVRRYQQNQRVSKPFSRDKHNAVRACHEENFTQAAVNLVAKFTTTAHKPPPQLFQQLYHDTLRECSSSYAEASIFYKCLKNIQHLHHPSSRDFPIEWNLIKSVATSLVSAPSEGDLDNNVTPAIKWHVDLLSLHFLVSILEDDIERKSRWDTLKKSFAFSILNQENCRNNCREVVEWIHKLVSELEPLQGIDASTNSSRVGEGVISCGCSDSACHRNYVLPMLEKLLELSFRMTNSWTLKSYLQRTVEELNSCGLRGLPQMRLLLETLQQPWLRLKLCDLLFNSHFESEIFGISRENVSVSRIVQEYFLYLPRPTPVNNNDGEDEEVMETRFSRSSREQMVYLLLVMLQSYLKCCSGCLSIKEEQGKKSSSLSKSSALWSSLYRKQLSDDDRICLLQMGDYVDQLRNHLRSSSSHHPGETSMVTEVCLAQMSVLYEWM